MSKSEVKEEKIRAEFEKIVTDSRVEFTDEKG
jgi:hypothetical protein